MAGGAAQSECQPEQTGKRAAALQGVRRRKNTHNVENF